MFVLVKWIFTLLSIFVILFLNYIVLERLVLMEYQLFKEFLFKILRVDLSENTSSNGSIILKSLHDSNEIPITFNDDHLRSLFESTDNFNTDSAALYTSKTYEVGVKFNYPQRPYYHELDSIECVEDNQHQLTYSITPASSEYVISAFKQIFQDVDYEHDPNINRMQLRREYGLFFLLPHIGDSDLHYDFIQYLSKVINCYSLKITSESKYSIERFTDLKNAYIFNFSYNSNMSLTDYPSFSNIMYRETIKRNKVNVLNTPPHRIYNSEIIEYYKIAMSSNDPYIKYISFYHVIEHYLDKVYYQHLIEDMRDLITKPDFNYISDKKISELINMTDKRLKNFGKFGQGNELESIKFVLKDFVPIDDLKSNLSKQSDETISFYQNNKVTFSDGPNINWNNSDSIIPSISKRIYFTRNSLIHSKSEKKAYHAYQDRSLLEKEIPLIKVIAELVIINSGKIIN